MVFVVCYEEEKAKLDLEITAKNASYTEKTSSHAEISDENNYLPDERALLLAKVQSLLGLARRARAVQLGLTAVTKAVTYGEAELVFLASDLAQDSRRKLFNLLQNRSTRKHQYYCCSLFSKAELSAKLDSERAILALKADGFGQAIKQALLVYKEQLQACLINEEIEPSRFFAELEAVFKEFTAKSAEKEHLQTKRTSHKGSGRCEQSSRGISLPRRRPNKQHRQRKFSRERMNLTRREK